jgi:hypothetical protein
LKHKSKRPLTQTISRLSFEETAQVARDKAQGQLPTGGDLYVNAFLDIRQTLMHIVESYQKQGTRCWVLQDADCKSAICIRVMRMISF